MKVRSRKAEVRSLVAGVAAVALLAAYAVRTNAQADLPKLVVILVQLASVHEALRAVGQGLMRN